ncbi:unnamed protein product [Rotaria sordida]|uniref:Uncharacterized protein n=1 Tax=Rotaria sordida TaxID=392033 RepID=A0A819Z1Z2_9BILA|nr:unnamed protein product [Rotaria sordida]CAF4167339.1 unnamed protein product [Rotaria sordida]
MEANNIRSRSNTPCCSKRNQEYQTTYRREFALKRSSSIDEGVPFSQQFLIGCPFQLNGPIGESLYRIDFTNQKNVQQEPFIRPNTHRANRPHPHKQFPYWPRRSERASQGFCLPMAYNRSHPFWRERARYTLDSEYRNAYQNHPKSVLHTGGRYSFSCRVPADAIVPQTVPVWKKRSLRSIYEHEISQKTPSELYMKGFVDSLSGPMG